MSYLYPEVENWKECSECVMTALIEHNNKPLCADCYAKKIWHTKLENVPNQIARKELQEEIEYAGGKAYYEMLKMFRDNKKDEDKT